MNTLYLPPPTQAQSHASKFNDVNTSPSTEVVQNKTQQPLQTTKNIAPSYEERLKIAKLATKNKNTKPFVPRTSKDFDDGGAFPEIHIAQYPRQMGNPHVRKGAIEQVAGTLNMSRTLLNVEVDEHGKANYDAVITGGTNAGKKVFTKHRDIVPLSRNGEQPKAEDVALPSGDDAARTAERTGAALQALISTKVAAAKPTGSAIMQAETSRDAATKTKFVSYTADPDAPGYNPACKTRVIQMVDAQIDPMMPPKFKHKKAPRGPAEDPVPVLHSKPAKLTKEERDAWKVPACISNWKNTRGYTIPLDKRLAADGRNLIEHSINPNFANLAESLYVAERQAREEVSMRAKVRAKLAEQQTNQREEELRNLAMQARMERNNNYSSQNRSNNNDDASAEGRDRGRNGSYHDESSAAAIDEGKDNRYYNGSADAPSHSIPASEDDVALRQREMLRRERKRQHEREIRLENSKHVRARLEDERDVSEKIALGQHTGTGGGGIDNRLYNQEGGTGMDSGFGADDEFNAYSKPLFDSVSTSIYKPTNANHSGQSRGPVQFEKSND